MSIAQSHVLDDGTARLSRRAWGALLVLAGAIFLDTLDRRPRGAERIDELLQEDSAGRDRFPSGRTDTRGGIGGHASSLVS